MRKPVILAVDDDPVNLRIIGSVFEGSDYELVSVDNGVRALRLLEAADAKFDVVLLDRVMPQIDGLEVLHLIKETPHLAQLPVIMQTAAAAPEQVAEGLRAGAHYYLTKPYTRDALRMMVRSALEDSRRSDEHLTQARACVDALRFVERASFTLRTLDEVAELSNLLAALCPEPGSANFGLRELLVNAVEHGNLGISYREKSRLKREGNWQAEVHRRSALPEYRDRRVHVTFSRDERGLWFDISDEGNGFVWKPYLELDAARAFDPNGRGIALARSLSFTRLEYQGPGNRVIATIEPPPPEGEHSGSSVSRMSASARA
ncbi:MAG TPA: response regulator [Polyangiales bacterium]|nr:response regulator [Polyangiales bacterium]